MESFALSCNQSSLFGGRLSHLFMSFLFPFAEADKFPPTFDFWEMVFGGLVWILVSSSHVPIPLIQGWVMFASVFCFVATTVLAFLYVIGAHGNRTSWITLDAAYHCVAALFYFGASVLEALVTIQLQDGFFYKYYHENISAVVFSYVATLLYMVHAVFSLIRCKASYRNREHS
uniref:Myelin and lymphocyte protein n=1 Tax=Capra hircus TaxID=9925 RepID=A0A8C2QWX4_CAPHI